MLRRLSLLACLLFAAPAFAQDAGSDAGRLEIPDGSVGEGGADRDSQEQEDGTGRVAEVCVNGAECSQGFACVQGRCKYVGTRDAEGGCLLGVQAALFLGGFGLMVRRSRRRR